MVKSKSDVDKYLIDMTPKLDILLLILCIST